MVAGWIPHRAKERSFRCDQQSHVVKFIMVTTESHGVGENSFPRVYNSCIAQAWPCTDPKIPAGPALCTQVISTRYLGKNFSSRVLLTCLLSRFLLTLHYP